MKDNRFLPTIIIAAAAFLVGRFFIDEDEPSRPPFQNNAWQVEHEKKLEGMRERQQMRALQQQFDRIESNTSKPALGDELMRTFIPAGEDYR